MLFYSPCFLAYEENPRLCFIFAPLQNVKCTAGNGSYIKIKYPKRFHVVSGFIVNKEMPSIYPSLPFLMVLFHCRKAFLL